MRVLLYSSIDRKAVNLPLLSDNEEEQLWEELTRDSDIISGWSNGCARLCNTQKTIDNFQRIEKKYRQRFPSIQQITHFPTSKVRKGSIFYILNDRFALLSEKMSALEVLKHENSSRLNQIKIHNQSFEVWSILSFIYDIEAFGIDGNILHTIGNDKPVKDRICRFCHKPHKTYDNVAHAIPESLGNKIIFCAEECDECNSKLELIEKEFLQLMDFRRAMYRIARKKGTASPTIHGRNYTITPNTQGDPILHIKKSSIPQTVPQSGKLHLTFHHYESVTDQNIYRALVKMVIDVCSSDRLSDFSDVIDWVTGKNSEILPDAMPSVLYGILPPGIFYDKPVLYLFFRKNDDMTVPYCTAVLFITDLAYQFVIPFVAKDEGRFKYDDQLENSRLKLNQYFNIMWDKQAYFSWWTSTIWNEWTINLNDNNIQILADNNPVFKPIKNPGEDYIKKLNEYIFASSDIESVTILKENLRAIIKYLTNKRPFSIWIPKPMTLELDLLSNIYTFELPIITDNKDECCVTITGSVNKLDRFYRRSPYITGETFSSLLFCIWKKAVRNIDRYLSKNTRKRDVKLFQNIGFGNYVTSTKFNITLPNGNLIKTDYISLVDKRM